MSSKNIYEADISLYKYYRLEYNFADCSDLIELAKEIIYQNYWCDCVMFEFLRSDYEIEDVIKNIKIKSWEEYIRTGLLW